MYCRNPRLPLLALSPAVPVVEVVGGSQSLIVNPSIGFLPPDIFKAEEKKNIWTRIIKMGQPMKFEMFVVPVKRMQMAWSENLGKTAFNIKTVIAYLIVLPLRRKTLCFEYYCYVTREHITANLLKSFIVVSNMHMTTLFIKKLAGS